MIVNTDVKIVNVNLSKEEKKDKDKNKEKMDKGEQETNEKIPQKRVVTETDKWSFNEYELTAEYEKQLISEINKKEIIHREHCEFILQQIRQKIYGYKTQDVNKQKLQPDKLICIDNVIQLMSINSNLCYYCNEPVKILYENVREPKQWTLDRIDNDYGHNNDTVFLACLSCILRRRTMYHERYVFTKQLTITKV
jgi:hypothetical protein